MWNKILIFTVSALVISSYAFWNNGNSEKFKKVARPEKLSQPPSETENIIHNQKVEFNTDQLVLEGSKNVDSVVIGPEIPVTGLAGFYNYQFNGNNGHYINRVSATVMHAIYMCSSDSLNMSATRRTKYAFSTDDGTTWTDLGEVPLNLRSGFCSLTAKNDGSAVIGNHYVGALVGGNLAGWVNYDLLPGIGSFTGVEVPPNFVWPLVATLTNGNILVLGTAYQGILATDTTCYSVFNTTSNTFGPLVRLTYLTPPSEENNSSMSSATAPGGKATILLNPYRETQGNWGKRRIFEMHSNDNGGTFTAPAVIFNPHVVNGDSVVPNTNGACDVILDASGNYYAAFNSLGNTGFFANARLYVIKQGFNSGEPILVGGGPGTPPPYNIDSMATQMVAENFIASFDHPCLSLSDDGNYVFVSYSVSFQNDTSAGGFSRANIFYSYAPTSTMVFSAPIRVTTYGWDHKYASINRVTPKAGNFYSVYMTYQKCKNAGAYSTGELSPYISKAFLIFRKITDATLIGVSNNNEIVKDYKLSQNYPNPFNPSTKISFSLPKSQSVTLKVFNVMGQEVASIINNKVYPAGVHEVDFSAEKLSSGIYFYTIEAGSFVDTKKMIILK
jgi:hypothetical protein